MYSMLKLRIWYLKRSIRQRTKKIGRLIHWYKLCKEWIPKEVKAQKEEIEQLNKAEAELLEKMYKTDYPGVYDPNEVKK